MSKSIGTVKDNIRSILYADNHKITNAAKVLLMAEFFKMEAIVDEVQFIMARMDGQLTAYHQ